MYSLSHVVDHPMSSPCCVAKAGPVLAYRIMYLNDVVPASSPMIYLDIFTSVTTGQYLDNKGVDPDTCPELSRRLDRVQSMCVPPVSRKLLAFFPPPLFFLFSSSPPPGLVDPPRRE